ncbi:MAG TPA: serine/threonine-protein kinase [Planctomycetota bacterium]|jgi:serine/threonine protein kinase
MAEGKTRERDNAAPETAVRSTGESGRQSQELPTLAGFKLLNKVGQGGMGAVFRARQISMDRIVALKILPKRLAQNPTFKERFIREARLSAQLSHVNLINGIDCGEQNGYTYFAMEYVDGQHTKDLIKQKGKLGVDESIRIVQQTASALEYAHQKQFIHRDVKPENIMLTADGTAKLCDLGLARSTDLGKEGGLTIAGQAVGTPHYLSPEQARGEHDMTPATDIYSLGATFYHYLTGQPLFDAPTAPTIMAKHLTEVAKPVSDFRDDVPLEYEWILYKCLAKLPGDRYANGSELLSDLDAAKSGGKLQAVEFRGKSSISKPSKLPAPRRAAAAVAVKEESEKRIPVPMTLPSASRPRPKYRRENNNAGMLIGMGVVLVLAAIIYFNAPSKKRYVEAQPDTPPVTPNTPARPVQPIPQPKPMPIPIGKPNPGATPGIGELNTVAPLAKPTTDAKPDQPATTAADQTATKADPTKPALLKINSGNPELDKPSTAAAAALASDPQSELTHFRYLNQLTKRIAKLDLSKAEKEAKDLAAKEEFASARDAINLDLRDLQASAAYEQRALVGLARSKGAELALPADHPVRKLGGKVTVEDYDPQRGLSVSAGGARMPLQTSSLPVRMILDGSGTPTGADATNFCLFRNDLNEAQKLVGTVPEADRSRAEAKIRLLKAGEPELLARVAYGELVAASKAKQWKTILEKADAFDKAYADTPTAQQKAGELAVLKEFAADVMNPYKAFHAKSMRVLADGMIELLYDFSSPQQLQAFTCEYADLTCKDDSLRVPEGGGAASFARLIVPIAELQRLEVTGKTLSDSAQLGVLFLPLDERVPDKTTPKCICRIANRAANLEGWSGPIIAGKTEVNWSKDLKFVAEAKDEALVWTVGGKELGTSKFPPTVDGFRLCFYSLGGNHVWTNLKLVIKPSSTWRKPTVAPADSKAAPPPPAGPAKPAAPEGVDKAL